MCLIIKKAETITKPMAVYVVRKIYDGNNYICSPYYYSIWELGETKYTYQRNSKNTVNDFEKGFEINGDYFHSFENLNDAKYLAEYLNTRRKFVQDVEYVVFEAEIKPSLIVYGDFEFNYTNIFLSIASSNLTLIRKIGE